MEISLALCKDHTPTRGACHTGLSLMFTGRGGEEGSISDMTSPVRALPASEHTPTFLPPPKKSPVTVLMTTQCSTIYFTLAKTSNFNFKNYFYCTPSRKNVMCSYTKTINTISVPSTSSPSLSNTVPLRLLNPNSWRQHLGSRLSLASA